MQFVFDDHILDIDRRELRRGSVPVAVEPQVFDLLVYLLQNRDRVVSKDDLIGSVWGGRIVSDSTLASRINAARKAVVDNGDEQRLIRTLPRRGIRFVGEVRVRAEADESVQTAAAAVEAVRPIHSAHRAPISRPLPSCPSPTRQGGTHAFAVITATYLAVFGLIYTVLSLRVALMRRGNRTAFGDGDNASLRAAIRAHAHFAEYVPIIVLMVGALELLATPAVQLHMLLGTLLVSRIIHPFGLQVKPGTMQFLVGRVFGMTLTIFVLVTSALLLLRDLVLR